MQTRSEGTDGLSCCIAPVSLDWNSCFAARASSPDDVGTKGGGGGGGRGRGKLERLNSDSGRTSIFGLIKFKAKKFFKNNLHVQQNQFYLLFFPSSFCSETGWPTLQPKTNNNNKIKNKIININGTFDIEMFMNNVK